MARPWESLTVGIDAEIHDELPAGVLEQVSVDQERAWLAEALGGIQLGGIHWDRLLFSAKESVYKAWQPLTGEWLGHRDAELSIDPARGSFEARLLVPAHSALETRWRSFQGRFAITPTHVLTAVALLDL